MAQLLLGEICPLEPMKASRGDVTCLQMAARPVLPNLPSQSHRGREFSLRERPREGGREEFQGETPLRDASAPLRGGLSRCFSRAGAINKIPGAEAASGNGSPTLGKAAAAARKRLQHSCNGGSPRGSRLADFSVWPGKALGEARKTQQFHQ